MWNDAGDEAVLYAPSGTEIGRVGAEANAVGEAEPPTGPVGELGADGVPESKCAIM